MIENNKLIIIGTGGHAKSILDVVELQNKFDVVGFVDNNLEVGSKIFSYNVLGKDEELSRLIKTSDNALIAVGQIQNPDIRNDLYIMLKDLDFKLPSVISPRAHVSESAFIDEGTVVMHGAIVNAGAKIGANCIINSGAIIEHDAEIGKNCHISTGVIINGSARVGNSSFIGSGSVIRNNISIGERCIVGMGSKVLKDMVDNKIHKN